MSAEPQPDRAVDPYYLTYQYATAERLRIRQETHRLYSESSGDFFAWVVDRLEVRPGDRVVDIGSGPGAYYAELARRGAAVVAVDASFGMAAEARRAGAPSLQAGAEALPLMSGCAARAMANHMLYHVPDIPAALREVRRVLASGGRAVFATNAADSYAPLTALHRQAASSLGLRPSTASPEARFSLDSLALVQQVFPDATLHVRPDALLFPTTEAVLRYYASGLVDLVQDAPADGSHRPKLLAMMEASVRPLLAAEGVWRVPKDAGCFVATV